MYKKKVKDSMHNEHLTVKIVMTASYFIGLVLLCFMLVSTIYFIRGKSIKDFTSNEIEKKRLGLELVNAMYTFDTPRQLDSQMLLVKEIVSEPVYSDLTIDNEQRTLSTYFRFKGCSCKVCVIESTDNYVLYTLDSDAIEPEREFMLIFRVNDDGVIDWVKEIEAIEFRDTIY